MVLTLIMMKIFERLVKDHIVCRLHPAFNPFQFASYPNHSKESPLYPKSWGSVTLQLFEISLPGCLMMQISFVLHLSLEHLEENTAVWMLFVDCSSPSFHSTCWINWFGWELSEMMRLEHHLTASSSLCPESTAVQVHTEKLKLVVHRSLLWLLRKQRRFLISGWGSKVTEHFTSTTQQWRCSAAHATIEDGLHTLSWP